MTHFIGAALVPAIGADPASFLTDHLARFDEQREVEPYIENEDWRAELARAREFDREQGGKHEQDSDLDILKDWSGDWREDGAGGYVRYTSYNPDSRFDWWVIGGRWNDVYADRQGETVAAFREKLTQQLDALRAGVTNIDRVRERSSDVPSLNAERELPWHFPASLVTLEPEWLRQAQMGWWGMRSDEMGEEEWIEKLLAATEGVDPAVRVYYLDFHI